jgi:hypothetical protein
MGDGTGTTSRRGIRQIYDALELRLARRSSSRTYHQPNDNYDYDENENFTHLSFYS